MQKGNLPHFDAGPMFFIIMVLLFLIFSDPISAQTTPSEDNLVRMMDPTEGSEVIGKKPVIRFSIAAPFIREGILVMIDGVDITPVLEIIPDGFTYTPNQILPAGAHLLVILGYTVDGREFSHEFQFTSRHYHMLSEAYSTNDLSAFYTAVVNKSSNLNLPYSKAEANLSSTSALKEKGWNLSLTGNLRYLDQSDSVEEPLNKGINLIDYSMKLGFIRNRFGLSVDVGDTIIEETENTHQQLARRGGQIAVRYDGLTLGGFIVKGKEVYGFDGGMGLETDDTDHIMGLSGESKLLSDRITLKGVYIRGGERGNYFGTSNKEPDQNGNVYGVQLKTDFLSDMFVTDFEYDYSRFDPDTSDDIFQQGDEAYRFGVSGVFEKFNYKAAYKYFGRYYEIVGNRSLEKDWEGVILEAGANLTDHLIKASYDQHHDNVEGDPSFPTFHTYQGHIEYSFVKFASLPVTLGYAKAIVDSTDEPESVLPFETHTDTYSGSVIYYRDRLSLGLLGSYLMRDDQTPENDDTTIATYSFTPSQIWDHLSVNASLSYILTEFHLTKTDLETYTVSMDIQGDFLGGQFTYELAGTYNRSKSNTDETDQESYGTNGRVAYLLGKNLWGYLNPSVGIKALYNKTSDWVSGKDIEEHAISFFISTSIPLSF